jgi:hypothetical protein
MNGKRVDAAGEFPGERCIYHAMALDSGLSFEGVSHDIHPEMGLAAFAVPGMAFVLVRFILHLEALGRKSLGQLLRDGIGGSHAARVKRRRRAGQWPESRRIGTVASLSSLEGFIRKGA